MIEVNGHMILDDMQDILSELRSQLALSGVQRFAKFIQSGNNIQTNCPFHKDGQERKPSFGISTRDGTCHCFGCGWAGTLPEMISNCFGYDDFGQFGNKWLAKNFLSVSVEEREEIEIDFNRNSSSSIRNLDSSNYVSEDELDTYRYYHEYMWKRKLNKEVVELFDIGYDKETECITFPNRDVNGNCLFIARRSVNTKYFNYPANVEKPVYGIYELQGKDIKEVIICESMLDALTCWVYGKYAVALNGLGTQEQFNTLRKLPCRKFILATDMDDAGQRARRNIRKALSNKIVTEYIWDIKVAKDINDMSKEYFENLQEVM